MDAQGSVILTPEEQQLSLEDRRLARREHLHRWLTENPEQLRSLAQPGRIAAWQKGWEKSKVLPWQQSMTPDGPVLEPAVKNQSEEVFVNWDVPDIRKRTQYERVTSMVERLKSCPAELQEALLGRIAGEYWKIGSPVATEDLRRVAAEYLNRADNTIRVTRQ